MTNPPPEEQIHEVQWDGSRRFSVSTFATALGWVGLGGDRETVFGMVIGHPSKESAEQAGRSRLQRELGITTFVEADWFPSLRRRLERFALGESDDFRDVAVASPKLSPFQRDVLAATRRIGCGEVRTYAELAEDAGHPRAARAVGNVMAANRVPILIPCHRVVASGGKWGGFSAPQGVDLKRRMLDLEAEALAASA